MFLLDIDASTSAPKYPGPEVHVLINTNMFIKIYHSTRYKITIYITVQLQISK